MSASTAPVAGAAAAAAVGAAAWGRQDEHGGAVEEPRTDEERADEERSARIASAADYRDDAGDGDDIDEPATEREVWAGAPVGTSRDMSDSAAHDEPADTTAAEGGAAARRPASEGAAADAESPHGEWGGPRDDAAEDGAPTERTAAGSEEAADDADGISIVADTDSYAASEPVLAEDQADPVEPTLPDESARGLLRDESGDEERAGTGDGDVEAGDAEGAPGAAEHPDTEAVILADTDSYASTEPALADGGHLPSREAVEDGTAGESTVAEGEHPTDESVLEPGEEAQAPASERVEEPTEERYDPTSERDWGADEGDLLAENRERGDRLAEDREALDQEAERSSEVETSAVETSGAEQQPDPEPRDPEQPDTDGPSRARRVSEFHEIRDGGFGVGSAAPLEDGAQPMDHPVAGYRDTMTFRTPDDAGYADADPDVWFYDEGAAERSGFRRSEG